MGRKSGKEDDAKDKEELAKLWKEYTETRSIDIRDQLITRYLHLVKYVVGRLLGNLPPHINVEDMFSTGVMGLIKATEKFDPTMKNKFETYAILLIKGAIIDELRALDWVPRSVHQKAHKIADAQHELQQRLGREPSDEELAKEMGLQLSELDVLMNRVRPAIMLPLNADPDEDSENTSLAERIPDRKAKTSFEIADRNEFCKLLEKSVLDLPEQERIVLVLYYYENLMLKEIGEVIGVSESRISQIHAKAILRLKGRLQKFIVEYANMI